jgi:hypothetical protein
MEWYYAEGDRQCGPVSENELQQLATSGRVRADSLVWREGMENWTPFSSVQLAPPLAGAATLRMAGSAPGTSCSECGLSFPPNELVRVQNSWICATCKPRFMQKLSQVMPCCECGRPFSVNDMVQVHGSWVCAACKPRFLQRLSEGAPPVAVGSLWRSGNVLVASKNGSSFPDRCFKCNASTNGRLIKRTLYWYPPWVIIVLLASVLIGLIVAMIVRKTAVVEIGVCELHRKKRIRNILIGSGLMVLCVILLVVSIAKELGIVAILSLIAFIAGIVFFVLARFVSVQKIDDNYVWIKGVCQPYLSTLPEWRG